MSDDQDGYEWVFLLVLAYPGSPGPKAIKWLCVCVCVLAYISPLPHQLLTLNRKYIKNNGSPYSITFRSCSQW